jgi:hypothetical protein
MDAIDAILNFFNITDNAHYVRKEYNKLIDKNEYLGSRILSFLSLLLTLIAILFFIYALYLIFK